MPLHTHLYSRCLSTFGDVFDRLLRSFFIVVRPIHGLVESTKLASLQIANEDGNQDSKEAVEDVQHTEDQGEFGLTGVGRAGAREVLTVAVAGRHGSRYWRNFSLGCKTMWPNRYRASKVTKVRVACT